MKKINYLNMFALTATAAMLLPSCSNDDIDIQTGDATVTLSATLPESLQTRSFGDGLKAKNLQMVVLEAGDKGITGGNLGVFDGGATVYKTTFANGSLTTNVPVKLVTGKKYAVICWSDAGSASPYKYDAEKHEVEADYTGFSTSDDNLDAFYAYQTFTVEGDGTQTIQLRRPFAQLNIGTDDFEVASKAGFTATQTEVTVPVSNHLYLETGEVNDPVATKFIANDLPKNETFPTSAGTYKYLSMNYVLTGVDKSLVDVDLTVTGNGNPISHTFNTVPVQRNYRTNIYGSILTNAVNVQVEIVPDFDGMYNYAADVYKMVADLSAGKDVALVKDLEPTQMMKITGGHTVSLNLNGKTIANKDEIWDESGNALLSLEDGTTLTINGNGTLKPKADDCYGINVRGGSHLIIEDGYFYGNVSVVQVEEGTAEIKGGTFELLQHWNPDAYFLNCIDAAYKEDKAHIIVTGGKFIGFNPADCAAEGAHTNFVAPGYVSVLIDAEKQTYQVVKASQIVEVASASDILNAFKTDNNAIRISSDISVDSYLMYTKKAETLVFSDGAAMTAPSNRSQAIKASTNSTLNIYGNGRIAGPSNKGLSSRNMTSAIEIEKAKVVNIFGDVIVEGGKGNVLSNKDPFVDAAVVLGGGTLNIYGGIFRSYLNGKEKGRENPVIYLHAYANTHSVCNIYGGVFEAEDAKYVLNIEDGDRSSCKFNVMGGTFVGFNPASVNEGTITSFVAPGYKSVKTTWNGKDAWKVVKQ